MSEMCVEHCAQKRDTSYFQLKRGVNMENIPRYPLEEIKRMTKEEKFMSVVIYLSKVVDHLKGVDNGQDIYSSRSRRIFEDVEKQSVLFSATEEDTPRKNR